MDTRKAALAAADALGRAAAASLDRARVVPDYLRRAFDDPIAKILADTKPPHDPFAPPHPALDPKKTLKGEN